MSHTPADTAYGTLGNFFAGIVTQSGAQIETFSCHLVAFNTCKDPEAGSAPIIITNIYPASDEGGRRDPVFDGLWFSNQTMLTAEGTEYATAQIKGVHCV